VKNVRTAVTLVGTVLAARTALARIRQARVDNDRMELLDAAVNGIAVVTGVIVVLRRIRRGKAA
jgi:hypothetical protein